MRRIDKRGRPPLLTPPPNSKSCSPNMSPATNLLRRTILSLEFGGQLRLHSTPRKSSRQNNQRMAHVDHRVESGAEEVRCTQGSIPSEINVNQIGIRGKSTARFRPKTERSCGLAAFCMADEIQQAGHQADRQLGSPGVAGGGAFQHQRRTEHVVPFEFEDLARVLLAFELRRKRCFDLSPGKPPRQHRQRIVEVDHRVDASSKKVGRLHPRIPQKSCTIGFEFEGNYQQDLGREPSIHAAWRRFAGPTTTAFPKSLTEVERRAWALLLPLG